MKAAFTLISLALGVTYGAEWNHDQTDTVNGPSNWGGKCQTGKVQSPINFVTSTLKTATEKPFMFKNYDKAMATTYVKNNGHGINVEFTVASEADRPTISGGGLPDGDTYKLVQFHFHWGQDSDQAKGSEHTVDGVGKINEVHFVHMKNKFSELGEALADDEPNSNLAVIGAFFKLSDTDNPDLDGVLNALAAVSGSTGAQQDVTPFPFNQFLPKKLDVFYRYNGSLTTPGCSEVVFWTVMQDEIPISKAQMQKFQALTLDGTKALGNNYRPTLPENDRTIYKIVANSDCCPKKELSGTTYDLSDTDAAETAKYGCSDACVFKSGGKKFCFKDDAAGMDAKCVA